MGIMKKLAKSGMFGLTGLAMSKKGMVDKIARNGGLGLVGMMAAKDKNRPQAGGAPTMSGAADMGGRFGTSDRGENTKEFKKGGKTSVAQAVHKHERAKHKGQPLTKLAKGGSASRRADGCATKGKTKGKFV